jgi:hypothetical protein
LRRKKDERCKLCNNLLLHKQTMARGICKKCEPDLNQKIKVTNKNNKTQIIYKML